MIRRWSYYRWYYLGYTMRVGKSRFTVRRGWFEWPDTHHMNGVRVTEDQFWRYHSVAMARHLEEEGEYQFAMV